MSRQTPSADASRALPASSHPTSDRRSFLKWSGTAGLGLLVGGCAVDDPTSPSPGSADAAVYDPEEGLKGDGTSTVDGPSLSLPLTNDTDILKFALALELLESEFYKMAVASGLLSGTVLEISTHVRDHEICHVEYLQSALGSAATGSRITFDFSSTLQNEKTFLEAAETFEQTGVGAYLGALPLINDKNIRSAAGTVFTIEARHTAAFRALNNRDPVPVGTESPLSPEQVASAVAPFVSAGM